MTEVDSTLLRFSLKRLFNFELGWEYCRDCGLCLPCPPNIDIAAILRFKALHDSYLLKNWAKKLYRGLEVGAEKCTECGECIPKCPYRLPVMEKISRAHVELE